MKTLLLILSLLLLSASPVSAANWDGGIECLLDTALCTEVYAHIFGTGKLSIDTLYGVYGSGDGKVLVAIYILYIPAIETGGWHLSSRCISMDIAKNLYAQYLSTVPPDSLIDFDFGAMVTQKK